MSGALVSFISRLVLTVLAIVMLVWLWNSRQQAKEDLKAASVQLETTGQVLANMAQVITIFDAITAGREHEKERDRQNGEAERAGLHAALSGDSCAAVQLPADADRRLHEHANRIRAAAVPAAAGGTGAGNANAGAAAGW